MPSFEQMRLDYLNRAQEARTNAASTDDFEARAGWLQFADTYAELAGECHDFSQGRTPQHKN